MSLDPDPTKPSSTAYEVLAYLVEHPDAQDTLEGIMEWWWLEQQIKRWVAQVRTALAELVARGLVLEREGGDGQIHYRVNRQRLDEIRALLAETNGPETTTTGGGPD